MKFPPAIANSFDSAAIQRKWDRPLPTEIRQSRPQNIPAKSGEKIGLKHPSAADIAIRYSVKHRQEYYPPGLDTSSIWPTVSNASDNRAHTVPSSPDSGSGRSRHERRSLLAPPS